jgi:hypothetical protein
MLFNSYKTKKSVVGQRECLLSTLDRALYISRQRTFIQKAYAFIGKALGHFVPDQMQLAQYRCHDCLDLRQNDLLRMAAKV